MAAAKPSLDSLPNDLSRAAYLMRLSTHFAPVSRGQFPACPHLNRSRDEKLLFREIEIVDHLFRVLALHRHHPVDTYWPFAPDIPLPLLSELPRDWILRQ